MKETVQARVQEHSPEAPTHVVFPGARIKVPTAYRLLKWVTVQDEFHARILKKFTIGKFRDMGLFAACGDFDTLYSFDDGRDDMVVRKHAGDQFYAFTRPEDGKVADIPKEWLQSAFL